MRVNNLRRAVVMAGAVLGVLVTTPFTPAVTASDSPGQGYPPKRTFTAPYDDAHSASLCDVGSEASGLYALLSPTPPRASCTVNTSADKTSGLMGASMQVKAPDGSESWGHSVASLNTTEYWYSAKTVEAVAVELTLDVSRLVLEHLGATHASHTAYAIVRPTVSHDCSCATAPHGYQELLRLSPGDTHAELAPTSVVLTFTVRPSAGYPIPPGEFRLSLHIQVVNNLGHSVYDEDGRGTHQHDTGEMRSILEASLREFKIVEHRMQAGSEA